MSEEAIIEKIFKLRVSSLEDLKRNIEHVETMSRRKINVKLIDSDDEQTMDVYIKKITTSLEDKNQEDELEL